MSADATTIILTRNGIADRGQEAKLKALRQRLAKPEAKLLLHLHGGLVDQPTGESVARRLSGAGANSWQLGPEWTQLYVVWRTGAFETIRTNWMDLVHDDRVYQTILRKLIRFVGERLGIPSAGGARSAATGAFGLDEDEIQRRITGQGDRHDPFGEIEVHLDPKVEPGSRASLLVAKSDAALAMEFEADLAADPRFQAAVADIDGVVNAGLPGRTALPPGDAMRGERALARLSPQVQREFAAAAAPPTAGGARGLISVGTFILKHAGMIAYRVFKRFRGGRDHGFHATIVEELCRECYGDQVGAKVWGMMTRDAADHFSRDGFGTQLLDLLGQIPPLRIAVTAHSAGSIWAAQMLLALAQRKQQAQIRLTLLAPAVRQDLFADALAAAGDRIECARMFTMTDVLERRDAVLGHDKGYIYPSSLLYCVSGMFEEQEAEAYADAPLVGMMRYADASWLDAKEAINAKALARFFMQPENGIVTSPTVGVTIADCHGCFDDEEFTLKSVAALF